MGSRGEPELLASCYQECLAMAEAWCCVTMSFPAISTGAYGYPLRDATAIAVRKVKDHSDGLHRIGKASYIRVIRSPHLAGVCGGTAKVN